MKIPPPTPYKLFESKRDEYTWDGDENYQRKYGSGSHRSTRPDEQFLHRKNAEGIVYQPSFEEEHERNHSGYVPPMRKSYTRARGMYD